MEKGTKAVLGLVAVGGLTYLLLQQVPKAFSVTLLVETRDGEMRYGFIFTNQTDQDKDIVKYTILHTNVPVTEEGFSLIEVPFRVPAGETREAYWGWVPYLYYRLAPMGTYTQHMIVEDSEGNWFYSKPVTFTLL